MFKLFIIRFVSVSLILCISETVSSIWYTPVDPSKNITVPTGPQPSWVNCSGFMRKSFQFTSLPQKVYIYAFPDSGEYPPNRGCDMYFNGQLVRHHTYSDVAKDDGGTDRCWQIMKIGFADVTSLAVTGTNVFGIATFSGDSGTPGSSSGYILAKIEIQKTDGSWERFIVSDTSWKTTSTSYSGWYNISYNDSSWSNCSTVSRTSYGEHYFIVIPHLQPERIFSQNPGGGTIQNANNILAIDGSYCTMTRGSGNAPYIELDLGRELTGEFKIKARSTASATIRLVFDESRDYNNANSKSYTINGDTTITTQWFWTGRFVKLYLDNATTSVDIDGVEFDFYNYPVNYTGSFVCSDSLLNRIWECGAFSSHMCMQHVYVDGCKMERMGWIADALPEMLANYISFNDTELAKISIRDFSGSGNSFLQYDMVNNSLIWIIIIADYYRYTGDLNLVNSYKNNMVNLMNYISADIDSNGLWSLGGPLDSNERGKTLTGRDVWAWLDWGFVEKKGELGGTQMFYIWALKELSYLLRELGDSSTAQIYEQRASNAITAANNYLWSINKNCYVDCRDSGVQSNYTSRQVNTLAILSDTADSTKTQNIINSLFGGTDYSGRVVPAGVYIYQVECAGKVINGTIVVAK